MFSLLPLSPRLQFSNLYLSLHLSISSLLQQHLSLLLLLLMLREGRDVLALL